MIFGPSPLADACGAILAHSMQITVQGRARKIAKGTVLTVAHLQDLAAAGIQSVVVARLQAGDVEENAAARQLAHAIAPDAERLGLRISKAGAGRVNLYARHAGVAVINEEAVHALNAINPMMTIATVPPFQRMGAEGMLATIKIISYSVPQSALDAAQSVAINSISVASPQFRVATLIETSVGQGEPSPKGRVALAERLQHLGLTLTPRCVVAHTEAALSRAIAQAATGAGEVIFVLTASATSDPMDVGPQALRGAGGHVEAFGMPVDPGNLLFFGALGKVAVIGLPGCARSPALNGADWVLERLLCGITLTQSDISRMGVGGLLKEIPTRPRPRAG